MCFGYAYFNYTPPVRKSLTSTIYASLYSEALASLTE